MFQAGPARRLSNPPHGVLRDGLGLAPGMRVGLFGGSFNPAHEGHAHVAETALIRLGLDRVVWLVSPHNPLKNRRQNAPLEDRMASARAFARGPAMLVSDFERRAGVYWTIDTIRALQDRYPQVKFVWIMGADNMAGFHLWRGWTEIARLVPMAVVSRPGSLLESRFAPAATRLARFRLPLASAPTLSDRPAPAWVYLQAPLNHASSTALRAAARDGSRDASAP
ncbi:MAG TPA: nicotinate-nucleotide adenylyltransferase [Caulobacteraceae bacterium]|jgi:nicotinate-nucleotide adenylyltransferase